MIRLSLLKFFACLSIVFCFGFQAVVAQHVLMGVNDVNGDGFVVRRGSTVRIEYSGYLGQREIKKGSLDIINDSFIVLRVTRSEWTKIKVSDISGMRVYTPGRMIAHATANLAVVAGSILLYTHVLRTLPIDPFLQFGIGSVAVLGVNYLVKLIFSDKIKYKSEDGWRFITATERVNTVSG